MMNIMRASALFVPDLKLLLEQKDWVTLKQGLKEINPVELAEGWRDFTPEDRLALFRLLGIRQAVVVFEELEVEDQLFLLKSIGEEAADLTAALAPGEVSHLFRKLPRRVIRHLTHVVRRQESVQRLQEVLTYPDNSAGALMHAGGVQLKPEMTASQALEMVRLVSRSQTREPGLLSTLYVVGAGGALIGQVPLHVLVAAPHAAKIRELMVSARAFEIHEMADQEGAAQLVSKYNLLSAPVVDVEGRFKGVLLMDDVLDVIREEATEDIAKMAGADPEVLTSRSFFRSTRLRLPWLMVTFGGQLAVAAVISQFESILNQLIAMVSFMPLIAALGGSAGAQSATIMVRGLATGEFEESRLSHQILREVGAGLVCGALYGFILGGIAYLAYGARFHMAFAVSVALAAFVSMTIAASLGATVPIFFKRIGVDPAAASTPLISTITDLVSVTVYFSLASALLQFMV
ncbi:MAG: magnesium transporter [Candidatus Omnitrophica bacterium CG11_big_fil_rev_8_21_14_0_20_64_10]|nr:MAG: magnesium transporter [Candidatus Omnitrophica bacterium CG11_big_fil_rev_8_21_14_0_20_64_10]